MMSRTFGIGLAAVSTLLLAGCSDDGLSPALPHPTLLQAVAPAGGATAVDVGSTVTVTFSHPMMQGAEMLAVLHEGPVTGPRVGGRWSWSPERTRLTFTPARPLKPATQYTLHLGGRMADAAGQGVEMQQHGAHMGGQWATRGMMGGATHMGSGWQHANGSFGMVFSFTTAS